LQTGEVIIGGSDHLITGSSLNSVIVGGSGSSITIEGGIAPFGLGSSGIFTSDNSSVSGVLNVIAAGINNTITTSHSFIGGGLSNSILQNVGYLDSSFSTILGGVGNIISGSTDSLIGAGINNLITSGSSYSSIIGSKDSTISGGLSGTTIIGGNSITATTNNTVYIPNLNIGNISTGTSVNNLGIVANGNVIAVTGITETLTFMTGATGDVRTLTMLNGLVVGKTLAP